ncbi:MAG: hypothetical protein LBM95_04375 [Lactobacillales bacterium]|jgi:hypothetical protein|nr:hypothetical protein [Lactobacillales bacterium]
MKSQNIKVELYPNPAKPSEECLFQDDMLIGLFCVCEGISHEQGIENLCSRQNLQQYFEELQKVGSFLKHIEIRVTALTLDWQRFLQEVMMCFPQFVWVSGRCEEFQEESLYLFEFIPVAYTCEEIPFSIHLQTSLKQQFAKVETNISQYFVEKIADIVERFTEVLEVSLEEFSSEKVPVLSEKEESSEIDKEFLQYQESLQQEKRAKEQALLANRKLELIVEQMERQMLLTGLETLAKKVEETNDWYKRIKIDFLEYSRLVQKARFLERSWALNQELVTESERMSISSVEWVYEREKVSSLKLSSAVKEIYILLDECKRIESRVKVRQNFLFHQKPIVYIMKMDYNSLMRKAAYFDVLQGEICLLNREMSP